MIGYAPILGANYAAIMLAALRRAGLEMRVIQECGHTSAVAAQVASGLGVAIMPSWITGVRNPYLEFRPIPEMPRSIDLVLAWPAGEISPVLRDFVAVARRIAPQVAAEQGFALPGRA